MEHHKDDEEWINSDIEFWIHVPKWKKIGISTKEELLILHIVPHRI